MRLNIDFVVFILVFCACASAIERNDSWYTPIPQNDLQRCPQQADAMEVLPGVGFDNLNNKELGQVLAVNYSRCSTTLDRKYVLPDFVTAVPVKQSHVHLFSEMIDHWQNYSSTTSRTINAEAGGSFFGSLFSISGSFSYEHESVKKSMVEDRSVTVRAQLRHTFYRIQSEPDSQISPRCKDRLLEIASYIQRNDSYMSTYMSQLFVRDFGTHYLTNVDAGAVISKTDQINSNFIETFNEDKSKISAAASASFMGMIHAGASYTTTTDTKTSTEYKHNTKKSTIRTIGGPPFRANFTLNDWEDGLHSDLVPVDRSGDPIWFAVTPLALPELPDDTVLQLADVVKEAVRQYYLHNIHRGCTNINGKNFNPQANFDDGQCEPPNTNYTFGGVFQTCSGPSDFCSKNRQVNPKTRGYSCPPPYKAQLLYSFNGPRECVQHCSGWWIFKSCDWSCSQGVVNAYWCYADANVPKDSGYLFGGVYTDNAVNLITQEKTCPKMFYPLKIVQGYVCVSDDYELGFKYSYPFGGFISCHYGNPLAENLKSASLKAAPNSLKSFFQDKPHQWPKHCPKGYSQHLMQISHGCEINYCVQKNAFSDVSMPVLRRPPYVSRPVPVVNDTLYLLTASKKVLKRIKPMDWVEIHPMDEIQQAWSSPSMTKKDESGISLGGTVALTVFGTILAAFLVWLLVVGLVKYKRTRPYRQTDGPPTVTYTGGGRGLFPPRPSDESLNNETARLVV